MNATDRAARPGGRGRRRLVVVGGDAGGMSAASQARRLLGPDELEIVALERGRFTSYSACGIPYWVGGTVTQRDDLIARTPEVFRERHDIDVRTRHEVVAVDTERRTVTVRDLDGGTDVVEPYDELLLATGARPVRPPVPGIDARGVFGIQTLEDGQAVIDALSERAPTTAVVIGAGYIGLEMAEAMCLRGMEVTVVDRRATPMGTLDDDLGERVADALRGLGVRVLSSTEVVGIELGDDRWVTAVETSAGTLPADLVILGTGVEPLVELAEAAGIPIGPSGGIVTDRRQRTPVDGVWAAGDCAETFHRISQRPVSIPLGTIANKQGRVAGLNLGGGYGSFPGVLGTAVTKVCSLEIGRTGLGVEDARAAGFEVAYETIEARTQAGYLPTATPIVVKLLGERGTGRLLGAQILGEEGAAKRIDIVATALWNGMTAAELIDVDLAYAPPFSPVWDPVLVAARQLAGAV